MPLFYVNFLNDCELSLDTVGMEFDSVEDAYLDAYASVQEMWCELLRKRQNPMRCSFEITDTAGALLMVLPFSEIVDNCRGHKVPATTVHSKPFVEILAKFDRSVQLRGELLAQFAAVNRTLNTTRSIIARSAPQQDGRLFRWSRSKAES